MKMAPSHHYQRPNLFWETPTQDGIADLYDFVKLSTEHINTTPPTSPRGRLESSRFTCSLYNYLYRADHIPDRLKICLGVSIILTILGTLKNLRDLSIRPIGMVNTAMKRCSGLGEATYNYSKTQL
jgi:hypothetical protein